MTSRLFFDASALFAATYSSTGGSRELIRLAIRGRIEVLASQDVLDETMRNLERKAPDKTQILMDFLDLLDLKIVPDPTKEEVREAEEHVVQKDAPIIAAVKKAEVDFFVTLDKHHLLERPELAGYADTIIGTPREALDFVRSGKKK